MKRTLLIFCILTLSLVCCDNEKAVFDLTVNPQYLEFDSIGSTQKVYVGSNTAWATSSDKEWCRSSTPQKFGDDTVEITVLANTEHEERVAYISINNPEKTIIRTVKIIQKSREPANSENRN
jgi:hypothetical protein